mmetsp:Transcript_9753/g.10256  ORF Transcript_9753/g.10256 Transcript_9753/m.10256 type:complete len:173 (+) Transcript_9753:64-582(+)
MKKLSIKICCRSLRSTKKLAELFALNSKKGDLILLSGDLGTGKTTFTQSYIRKLINDDKYIVNSPSYVLDNTYKLEDNSCIHHIDLYRLPQNCQLDILGIPEIFEEGYTIIEWPERVDISIFLKYNPILITFQPTKSYRNIILNAFNELSINKINRICESLEINKLVRTKLK